MAHSGGGALKSFWGTLNLTWLRAEDGRCHVCSNSADMVDASDYALPGGIAIGHPVPRPA